MSRPVKNARTRTKASAPKGEKGKRVKGPIPYSGRANLGVGKVQGSPQGDNKPRIIRDRRGG